MAAELNCNWKEALSERECLLGNDSHFSYWASRTNMLASISLSFLPIMYLGCVANSCLFGV